MSHLGLAPPGSIAIAEFRPAAFFTLPAPEDIFPSRCLTVGGRDMAMLEARNSPELSGRNNPSLPAVRC